MDASSPTQQDTSGLFTASSFASRREPLSGNMRYRKIKDINRCVFLPLLCSPKHGRRLLICRLQMIKFDCLLYCTLLRLVRNCMRS